MEYNTFIMLGKPGSGKGEQSKLLAEKTGFDIVSSGGRFREIAMQDSIVGKKVGDIINNGHLMPHWFASYIFLDIALNLDENDGVIFDGAARKKPEAELFDGVMEWLERPYRAIFLNVSDDVAIERIMKRKSMQEREDDTDEAVRTRIKEYYEEAFPAIEHFRSTGKYIEINGEQDIDTVHTDILDAIGQKS